MSLYKYGQSSSSEPVGITEFEILKASHKFLREGDEKASSWDEQLAAKYYASLYREFALCDLKHYKSGNFALRWRTEEEVLSGSGETTCGNTRCKHHFAPRFQDEAVPLTTLELPFAYVEQGESKSALVKVVLCGKCLKKLMWKRQKEKEKSAAGAATASELDSLSPDNGESSRKGVRDAEQGEEGGLEKPRRKKRSREEAEEQEKERSSRKRRSTHPPSRSRSPRRSSQDVNRGGSSSRSKTSKT